MSGIWPPIDPMIICHCKGLNDREVAKAAREGAMTADDVGRFCAAGTECGGCRPAIEEIIAKTGQAGQGASSRKD